MAAKNKRKVTWVQGEQTKKKCVNPPKSPRDARQGKGTKTK